MTLTTDQRDAPRGPGVYCFLGPRDELLYIGKATDIRSRLASHLRDGSRIVARSSRIGWIETDGVDAAACLEADLIVALAPRLNRSIVADALTYIRVDGGFELTLHPEPGRTYGGFAHLGKGKISWPSVRINGGYSAMLRLLWAGFGPTGKRWTPSAKLSGKSPCTDLRLTLPEDVDAHVHTFLSGRSDRLLRVVRDAVFTDALPAYLTSVMSDDLMKMEEFYRLGPRALRALRLRHGHPAGPVEPRRFTEMLEADLRAAIGAFRMDA